MTFHICYRPYWDYCTDPLLAEKILDFMKFHERYYSTCLTAEKIRGAVEHSGLHASKTRVITTLHELREISLVRREMNAWKLVYAGQ
jgi:hypothetical protein